MQNYLCRQVKSRLEYIRTRSDEVMKHEFHLSFEHDGSPTAEQLAKSLQHVIAWYTLGSYDVVVNVIENATA